MPYITHIHQVSHLSHTCHITHIYAYTSLNPSDPRMDMYFYNSYNSYIARHTKSPFMIVIIVSALITQIKSDVPPYRLRNA